MPRTSTVSMQFPWYSADLQAALAALADTEAEYRSDCEQLRLWAGPEIIKERLLAQLKDRHQRLREPLIQRLTELQHRMGPPH
ncbi:hypothetical protein ACFOYU_04315 [Microvirga sp. GCM10011540]|uniref:hypothetical protein n=1 Tax=Microvirga sp. GCM10011540 TaxID=3317338 RepID=UPI00360B369E